MVGAEPIRNWKAAPGAPPRLMAALVIVTGLPISMSNPVPGYKFPNRALVYQSVFQAVLRLPSIAFCASCSLSPWPAPEVPNDVALAGASGVESVSGMAGVGVLAGVGVDAGVATTAGCPGLRVSVTGRAGEPCGSGFLPSTTSLASPGLASLMFTGCWKVHFLEAPAGTVARNRYLPLGVVNTTETARAAVRWTTTLCAELPAAWPLPGDWLGLLGAELPAFGEACPEPDTK